MKNDPIKNINSEYYLNDVSLKSRYKLMKVNQKNGRNGLDTGSHWAKDSVYPLIDDDIKHNLKKQYFDTIYNINKNNSELFSEMTNLKKTLSSLNQTSLVSESFRNLKNKMNSGIDDYNQKNIPSIYFNHRKNKSWKIGIRNDNFDNKKLIPFVTNSKEIKEKRKKIIYDIRPINTKDRKGVCVFPKFLNEKIEMNENIDFQKNGVKNKNDNKNFSSDKVQRKKIKFIKIKGEKPLIKLNHLINDFNLTSNNFTYRSRNKNENLYTKTIRIIEPSKTERISNKKTKKKINDWKYIDEVQVKKGKFPKFRYYMNYNYDKGAHKIKENNNKMDDIKQHISYKFNEMKVIVNNTIDVTHKNLDI